MDRIKIEVDGKLVIADPGDSIAEAIVRSGRWLFGRSVKYHRPRGPACFRGQCDGCLMRVDGVPNTMTCQVRAEPGMTVETQNVLGTAEFDVLALTDWMFPKGLDHHHMWTTFRPTNELMKKVARHIAGIGRLPDQAVLPFTPQFLQCDVLVIGGGPSGIQAANAASRRLTLRGRSSAMESPSVILIDDGLGGLERSKGSTREANLGPPVIRFMATALAAFRDQNASVLGDTAHKGMTVLAGNKGQSAEALFVIEAKALVFASGRYYGALAFVGSDLPGVINPDAALRLLSRGVFPDSAVLLGDDSLQRQVAEALSEQGVSIEGPISLEHGVAPTGFKAHASAGASSVQSVSYGGNEYAADWVVVASPKTTSGELAAQLGAVFSWNGSGFELAIDEYGQTAGDGVFATGSCAEPKCSPEAAGEHAALFSVGLSLGRGASKDLPETGISNAHSPDVEPKEQT